MKSPNPPLYKKSADHTKLLPKESNAADRRVDVGRRVGAEGGDLPEGGEGGRLGGRGEAWALDYQRRGSDPTSESSSPSQGPLNFHVLEPRCTRHAPRQHSARGVLRQKSSPQIRFRCVASLCDFLLYCMCICGCVHTCTYAIIFIHIHTYVYVCVCRYVST